jgi:hypothetical protein
MLKSKTFSLILAAVLISTLSIGALTALASDIPVWDEPGSWTALDEDGNPLVTVIAPDGTVFVPPTWGEAHANISPVLVNGQEIEFEAFRIGGYNYFKLRDIAYALSGTERQFYVGWEVTDGNGTISLRSGQAYAIIGGEMAKNTRADREPIPTDAKLLLDGVELNLIAYNIGGSNYFRLRDIAKVVDFSVEWDNGRILIDTSKGYTEIATDESGGSRLEDRSVDIDSLNNWIFGGRATVDNPVVISRSLEDTAPAEEWAIILRGVEQGLVVWAEDLE